MRNPDQTESTSQTVQVTCVCPKCGAEVTTETEVEVVVEMKKPDVEVDIEINQL